jgi:hypothetical protein
MPEPMPPPKKKSINNSWVSSIRKINAPLNSLNPATDAIEKPLSRRLNRLNWRYECPFHI